MWLYQLLEDMVAYKHCHNGHNKDDIICVGSMNSERVYQDESFTRFVFILNIEVAVSAA